MGGGVNSPTTLMEKETHLRVHILPALSELPLAGVSNEVLNDFFGKLREHGYGKKGRRVTSTEKRAMQKREERVRGRKDRGWGRGRCRCPASAGPSYRVIRRKLRDRDRGSPRKYP